MKILVILYHQFWGLNQAKKEERKGPKEFHRFEDKVKIKWFKRKK